MVRALPLLLLVACGKPPPPANPDFTDAAVYVFRSFDAEEAELAFGVRALEEQIALSMDVTAEDPRDRALTPGRLTEDDVAHLEHPDVPPGDALPVALAYLSAYPVDEHASLALLVDQTPLEPYSPDFYERSFLAGEDCWVDRTCEVLETWNELVKENFLMTVPYDFYKDYRWVDLGLPDPAEVPEGEEPVNEGEPRQAYVARAWQKESFTGEGGNVTLVQSYSIEIWVPQDDGGTLRMLSLWSQTDGIPAGEDLVAATTRAGIDDNMNAHEDHLAD